MQGATSNQVQAVAMSEFSPASATNQLPSQQGVPGVVIVNQPPPTSSRQHCKDGFPISYKPVSVLIISVLKCIIGFLQIAIGIADIFVVPYYTSWFAFPVWCGILFLVNGIIGSCTYRSQSRCMIGTFLALNITSLFFSILMLILYSFTLNYFVGVLRLYLLFKKNSGIFISIVSHSTMEDSIGLTSFLLSLIIFELCLSTAALVYSCRAYAKCCNSCDVDDCCTFIGCGCECCDRCCESSVPYLRHEDIGYSNHQVNPGVRYQTQQYINPHALQHQSFSHEHDIPSIGIAGMNYQTQQHVNPYAPQHKSYAHHQHTIPSVAMQTQVPQNAGNMGLSCHLQHQACCCSLARPGTVHHASAMPCHAQQTGSPCSSVPVQASQNTVAVSSPCNNSVNLPAVTQCHYSQVSQNLVSPQSNNAVDPMQRLEQTFQNAAEINQTSNTAI